MATWKSVLAVCSGASLGALLRWWLGARLNSLLPSIPPGTLMANLIGGYVVGAAIAYFSVAQSLSPEWRLLIITGFCGGLTTFSTFSVEVVLLLRQAQLAWALAAIAAHLFGSLAATALGILSAQRLLGWLSGAGPRL